MSRGMADEKSAVADVNHQEMVEIGGNSSQTKTTSISHNPE
jgi:hypothetical protein